ncbi:hypothetical protein NDU88_006679 [Pleurodeles waltl]|uniref:Uncharacterized protein n=1 Tax=Pleurodeles waltl TaxID=8319 RepID=A0AAV7VS32_PLEWA|nr:hypothetical protein NDU88_006679 [Pleurodeles waltl]
MKRRTRRTPEFRRDEERWKRHPVQHPEAREGEDASEALTAAQEAHSEDSSHASGEAWHRQDLTAHIKGLTREMNELWDQASSLEHTSDAHDQELDAHHREILELRDKNAKLCYQMEDLENRSKRANI